MPRANPPQPGPGARLLALDTATESLAIALVHGERTWLAEEPGGALASSRLLPLVFDLLARAELGLSDLDAIAFGRGPGAFTGLRTACSVAQGLAFGAGLPVLSIDSLAVVAEDAFAQCGAREVGVAMDARMGEIYAAAYRREGEDWRTVQAPALWPLAALAEAWRQDTPACVAGSALEAFGARLPTGAAQRVPRPQSRAAALAQLAGAAWRHGDGQDAALALPLYVRDKVALTVAERDAAKSAAAA